MGFTFAPAYNRSPDGSDMIARRVAHALRGNYQIGIDLRIASRLKSKLNYVHGDRVIGHFNDKDRSLTLERVGIDDDRPAYRVRIGSTYKKKTGAKSRSSNPNIFIRFGCTSDAADAFFRGLLVREYEFLEVSDKGAVFVESNK